MASMGLNLDEQKAVDRFKRDVVEPSMTKLVILDFYADWCISCKEFEKYTFSDAGVQQAMAGAVLLQADVTANDDADKALLKRFKLLGPPSILFFGPDGQERKNFRVVGFMQAEPFRGHVAQALGR